MRRESTVSNLTNADRLPTDRYKIRIVGRPVFGESKSSGNPMVTVDFEILSDSEGSDTIKIGDRSFNIGGRRIQKAPGAGYYTVKNLKDPSKDSRNMEALFDLFDKAGVPTEEIDENNPDLSPLEVRSIWAILRSDESIKCKEPTLEQRALGKRYGDPIKDADGNDVKIYTVVIDTLLQPA